MKFTTTKKNILTAVSNAERFTGKQITLPILQSVLFEVRENTCTIRTTNLELGAELSFPCKIEKDGVAVVSPKLLLGILQNTQEDSILFEVKQGVLFVETKTSNTKLNIVSPKEFPFIPKIIATQSFIISRESLIFALGQVLPAVSVSDFKPEINGVYLSVLEKNIICAATDTFRLAEKNAFLDKKTDEKFSCIIPFRMAQEITRTLGSIENEDTINMGVGDNQLVVSWGKSRIVSRVVDGNFPEYKTIIPKDFAVSFLIPREAILQRVRMATVLTGKLNDIVLRTKKNTISVLSVNPEVGTTSSSFATPVKGGEIMVTLNAKYFSDGIISCGGENIFIGMNNENSPILLKNPEDNSFIYIVMPIKNTP